LAFAALAWYGGRQAWDDYEMQAVTPALGLPSWLFSIWLPLVSLLICARALPVLIKGEYDDGVAA
jgi:TRAP-type C4-dicarboxylate transport system permease small subunit